MSDPLDPRVVAGRLAELRALFVAETVEEARQRLAREQPRANDDFEQLARRSLEELRALCELTRVLHAAAPKPAGE
ncbi:MAG TPA: hypothetical protein VGD37_18210 [Kofleriaceae bacterium]